MVKHIVLWNFSQKLNQEEKDEAGKKIKELLEGLKEFVDGVIELQVVINVIGSSNRDIALLGTFESRQALKAYQKHPKHIEAGKFVRGVTCDRACMDYEIQED